ncbi:MAG: hypothetical protein IKR04_02725 [Clostridia bacterium]|nr:hypothetical protein [Clostridia bacterium]
MIVSELEKEIPKLYESSKDSKNVNKILSDKKLECVFEIISGNKQLFIEKLCKL